MAAGPASYGMTDTMGRMHSDAQFAGSSSVPAHVEMMGLIGMGNNPMVGADCGGCGRYRGSSEGWKILKIIDFSRVLRVVRCGEKQ